MRAGDLVAAFDKHLATFGTLDICINNAGIANPVKFDKDDTDGSKSWKHTINVDLVAVVECTHLAVRVFTPLLSYMLNQINFILLPHK